MKRYYVIAVLAILSIAAFAGAFEQDGYFSYGSFGGISPASELDFTGGTLTDGRGLLTGGARSMVSGVTYIDQNTGLLKWARGNRTNYIERSYEFDNAYWDKRRATIETGIADPDGGNKACYIKCNNEADESHYVTLDSNADLDTRYPILSVHAKKADLSWLYMYVITNSSVEAAYFDLENGVVGETTTGTVLYKGMEDKGNGWYRCWLIADAGGIGSGANVNIHIAQADGDVSVNGNREGEGIHLYGAQLEACEGPEAVPGNELVTDGDFTISTVVEESDFSGGVDGWGAIRGTVAGNIDGIGGVDDTLRLTINTDNHNHAIYKEVYTAGDYCLIEFDYYIDAGNSHVDGIQFTTQSGVGGTLWQLSETGAWCHVAKLYTTESEQLRFYATDGGSLTVNDAGGDDVFYVKNIKVTEIDLDVATLTNDYTSDFSGGADSFSANGGAVLGNQTVGGEAEALLYTNNADNGTHYIQRINLMTAGKCYLIMGQVYIDAGNSDLERVKVMAGTYTGNTQFADITTKGSWQWFAAFKNPDASLSNPEYLYFYGCTAAGSVVYQDAGADDTFAIKNVTVDEVTFDNWTEYSGHPEASSGSLTNKAVIAYSSMDVLAQMLFTGTIYGVYEISATISNWSAGTLTVLMTGGVIQKTTAAADGTYKLYVDAKRAAAGQVLLYLKCSIGADFTVDDISVKEVTNIGELSPGPYTETSGSTADIPAQAVSDANGLMLSGGMMVNYWLQPRETGGWSTPASASKTANVTGIDGTANAAITLTDENNAGLSAFQNNNFVPLSGGEDVLFAVAIKKTTSATTFPGIGVIAYNGGTQTEGYCTVNTDSGTLTDRTGNAPDGKGIRSLNDDWWLVYVYVTDPDDGNTRSLGRVYPAINTDGSGTWANNVTGDDAANAPSCVVDCPGIYFQKYPPLSWIGIPDGDNTSPVAKASEAGDGDQNGYYWTMSNALKAIFDTNGEGTTVVKLKMGFDESVLPSANHGVLTVRESANSIMNFTHTQIKAWDTASNVASVSQPAWSYGDELIIVEHHPSSTDKFRIGYKHSGSWTWGSEQTYDGAFTLATYLQLAYANDYPMWIEYIKIYDRAQSTAWIEGRF
jgi:hypothetical protein